VHEVTLTNSIRYANGDAVEQWLYDLLCLDVADLPPLTGGTPDPASCDLYYVNRDTLFSYDRSAETFLKHLVNLYVSSHYKVSHFSSVVSFASGSVGFPSTLCAIQIYSLCTVGGSQT